MNTQIIALSPTDLAPAQQSLLGWCDQRIAHWLDEQREVKEACDHAIQNKWKAEPFRRALQKANRKIGFYRKIRAAIEAGYLIVPNFPLELFAIRTNAESARADESTYRKRFAQNPKHLPQGVGEYKNPLPVVYSSTRQDAKGKDEKFYWPEELSEELEIPAQLVKPEIMRAIDKARGLKLFDGIGICSDRQADPIVCGQIAESSSWGAKRVTFFIAWFVDMEDL